MKLIIWKYSEFRKHLIMSSNGGHVVLTAWYNATYAQHSSEMEKELKEWI